MEDSKAHARSPRLAADPITQRAAFTFSEVFASDDVVGHFVIGLAAGMNDLQLLNSMLMPLDDPEREDLTESEQSIVFRRLLGTIWELHLFVQDATKHPDVAVFLREVEAAYPPGQPYTGSELVAFMTGNAGATQATLRRVLRVARNATFHYPKVGSIEYGNALMLLGEREGELVVGERMPSLGANFAEEVLLAIALRELDTDDPDQYEAFSSGLAPVVIAVVHLAQIAVDEWLGRSGCSLEAISPEDAI